MKELEYKGPRCDICVDVAITTMPLLRKGRSVYLGRKKEESKYRFIGGFADINSNSLEDDAIREVREETNITIQHVHYIGSTTIPDKRYEGTMHKLKTAFFDTTVREDIGGGKRVTTLKNLS